MCPWTQERCHAYFQTLDSCGSDLCSGRREPGGSPRTWRRRSEDSAREGDRRRHDARVAAEVVACAEGSGQRSEGVKVNDDDDGCYQGTENDDRQGAEVDDDNTTTASTTKSSKTPTTTTTSTTISTVPLTPVQQKLQKNTNLAGKLETRLPKGTDPMLAAEGFRNLGQFVAAVNVSNNLEIPFADLKASMVDDGLSLGQSIKKWRPLSDASREASLAESQATVLINTTSTTTNTTTSKTTKKNSGNQE